MDPISRGPEEYGHDGGHGDERPGGERRDGERLVGSESGTSAADTGTGPAAGSRADAAGHDDSAARERHGASDPYGTNAPHGADGKDASYGTGSAFDAGGSHGTGVPNGGLGEGGSGAEADEDTDPERPPRALIIPGVTPLAPPATPAVPAGSGLTHLAGAVPPPVRTRQLVSGDFLLTVNPVDGSEIELCPPGRRPGAPVRRTAEERADHQRAGRPPVPAGPVAPPLPLLERAEERERLVGLVSRGRSVRLVGPAGSGRTALLDAVAADCADLAPDGVVRLSGHHRTATELLYELYAAVFDSALRRPDRALLLELVGGIGAVVVLDDLELGGEALDELLAATPECAYLLAPAPDADPPSADAGLDEVALGGLGRGASLELLERAVDRPLTDEEANWAGDLWFESEGLPLRFVQAGALLRQRDRLRGAADAADEFEPFERPADDAKFGAPESYDTPLPSVGEGAAPAALLASRLSESARATLRFAVALGGEVPHQAHLPALTGDTHADAAVGELMSCGLLTPVGPRYRLAPGVAGQLERDGYGDDAVAHALTAAQHYTWWAGHPSVTPERVCAEADAVLATLAPLIAGQEPGRASAAVLLVRSAAPAFLAGLHWGAWERALRSGCEAARLAGEVAEEAYLHHELGVLALCVGNPERARAELEASIGMRGAVADKSGTVAGRRALALVTDHENAAAGPGGTGGRSPAVRLDERAAPAVAALPGPPASLGPAGAPGTGATGPDDTGSGADVTLVTRRDIPVVAPAAAATSAMRSGPVPHTPAGRRPGASRRGAAFTGARRNLVAAGAGAVLAAVLGTVVTLGATSGNDNAKNDKVRTEQSTGTDEGEGGLPAEQPVDDTTSGPGDLLPEPGATGVASPSGGTPSGSPSPSDSPSPSGSSEDDDPTTPDTPADPPEEPSSPSGPAEPSDPKPTSEDPPPSEEPSDPEPTQSEEPPPSSPETTASGTSPSLTAGATETATETAPSEQVV
ncbi:ATP-binding protein [Streptomyces sp. NPDC095613]|uniref:ATP-binding protein n=1 Tax=Streptomyces sp. NPDC095613 TaxID=3155540 RepID=UPI003318859E